METTTTTRQEPTIAVRPALYERLEALAAREGTGVDELADALLSRVLSGEEAKDGGAAHAEMTLAELVAPLHADFAHSGMSEEEADALIEQAREEAFRERAADGK